MMETYLLVMIGFSAIFVAVVLRRTKTEIRLRTTLSVAATAILALMLDSTVLLLHVIVTLIALLLCGTFHVRRHVVVTVIVAAAVFAYAAIAAVTVQERYKLLRNFPIVSITDRLQYEAPINESVVEPESVPEITTPLLLPVTEERLAKVEQQGRRFDYRRELLRRLHESKFATFVVSEGFGPDRMPRVRRSGLELPTVEPVSPVRRPEQAEPPTAIQNPFPLIAVDRGVPVAEVTNLHDQGVSDFIDVSRNGYVKARQRVAGFVPHMLTRIPSGPRSPIEEWQISRLELVSLLKFSEPRVYLSEHLPRMDELRHAKTRPTDEFEQHALHQLRDGEDIILDEQLNTIRMVGAVRAAKQCLDCHSVRRGDLLGAFSYLLDRKQPIPPPKVEGKPVSMTRRPFHES